MPFFYFQPVYISDQYHCFSPISVLLLSSSQHSLDMRKILILTDFSANAMNAIDYALELFKYETSIIYFMHAYQDEIYNDKTLLNRETLDKVTKIIRKKSEKQLENLLKKVKEKHPNPRYSYRIIASNNVLKIFRLLKSIQFFLLV